MALIGFIGPGTMGAPMVSNLVMAGHKVRCFGRSERSRARAEATGAMVVGSIRDACADSDVAITMLPDGPDVLDVVDASDGILASLSPGSLYVDHSTISPETARSIHSRAVSAGIVAVDAPVSGGEAAAVEGTLSIMVGGSVEAFERSQPLLDAVGSTIVHVGEAGSGQVVKAANQILVAGNIEMLAEAVVFLEANHADIDAALNVIGGGLAGSTVLARKRQNVVTGDYSPGFRIELHDKDLRIVEVAARGLGLALPATALVTSLVAALKARGDGGLDHSALAKLARELNGVGRSA